MNPNIKAIIFDIGGTLRVTHSYEDRDMDRIHELLDFLNLSYTIDEFFGLICVRHQIYRAWSKRTLMELNEQDLWTRYILPDYKPIEFIAENAVHMNSLWHASRKKYILPDAKETIEALAERGFQLAIISNTTSSTDGPEFLKQNGLDQYFPSVIISSAFGRRKPHPSLFLAAARTLACHPGECAYIGDRPSRDLIGARQSGFGAAILIDVAGYEADAFDPDDEDPEEDRQLVLQPDARIGRLGDLLPLFEKPGPNPIRKSAPPAQPDFLYDAALSTMWGVDQKIDFNKTFILARKAGFARFELNHKVAPPLYEKWDANGFYIGTVHDPCPAEYSMDDLKRNDYIISSLDEKCRKKGLDLTKRTIELACRLGSRSVVVHPGMLTCDRSMDRALRVLFQQGQKGTAEYDALRKEMIAHRASHAPAHLEQVKKSLEELIEFSRGSGVEIGLENRYRFYDIPLLDEMEQLLNLCLEPWYGFQYDVGHAQVLGVLGLCENDQWLERFGKRMIGMHLHDVIGTLDHQAPGTGDVNFNKIARYLPASAHRTLEVSPALTLEQLTLSMEHLVATGCVVKI